MTFEEFFKKKKIDLIALQQGEQSLFSEFKTHYEQMGEKSFDHTKKYWFNKLRRQFPAAQEIKSEKVKIENPLAEQTITESLTESVAPVPKLGFAPKFRAASVAKPAEEKPEVKEESAAPVEQTTPKPAFKPRFNPGMVKPKITESEAALEEKQEVKEENSAPVEQTVPKPAFKPRFNPGMVKPKPAESEPVSEEKPAVKEEDITTPDVEALAAKPAYKPSFQAGMVKPKPVEEETKPAVEEKIDTPTPEEEPAAKPAYKPRFNMKNLPPKPTEE
jgi:hypothetical protein